MSYNSIIDKYHDYIKGDSRYYSKWLELYGTECRHLYPREDNSRMNDVYEAFGDQTFSTTRQNYEEEIIHLIINPKDFTRMENGVEDTIQVISPIMLDDGDLIEFRRLNKIVTFSVVPVIESYWDNYYRVNLKLVRVRDAERD